MLTKVGASGEFFGAGASPRAGLSRDVDVFQLAAWHRNLGPVFAQAANMGDYYLANLRRDSLHGVPRGNTAGEVRDIGRVIRFRFFHCDGKGLRALGYNVRIGAHP